MSDTSIDVIKQDAPLPRKASSNAVEPTAAQAIVPPQQDEYISSPSDLKVDESQNNKPSSFSTTTSSQENIRKDAPSAFECIKNLAMGPLKDLWGIVSHPCEAALMTIGFLALAAYAPVVSAVLLVGLAVGYGLYSLYNGISEVSDACKKKDWKKFEKSFEHFGSGAFSILTSGACAGITTRLTRVCGKITRIASDMMLHWYGKNFIPALKNKEPGAVAFLGANILEMFHIGHSALHMDAKGVLLGTVLLGASKYIYIGFTYVSKAYKATKNYLNALKENLIPFVGEYSRQLGRYVFRGERKNNVVAILVGDAPLDHRAILQLEYRMFSQMRVLPQSQRLAYARLADLVASDCSIVEIQAQAIQINPKLKPLMSALNPGEQENIFHLFKQLAKSDSPEEIAALQSQIRELLGNGFSPDEMTLFETALSMAGSTKASRAELFSYFEVAATAMGEQAAQTVTNSVKVEFLQILYALRHPLRGRRGF